MLLRPRFGVLVFVFMLGIQVAPCQQNIPSNAATDRMIHLNIVVTDSSGHRVSGLTQQDFTLLDNKVVRQLTSFAETKENQPPVQALIVLDAVNTPYTAVSYQRDQIEKYLRGNEGRLPITTNFAVFTDKGIELHNPPSKDGIALSSDLEHKEIGLREIGRSGGVYGAEDRETLSLNAFRAIVEYEAKLPGRKLVVWVSPGWPLLSGAGINLDSTQEKQIFKNIVDFSTQLRESHVALYGINSWGVTEALGQALYYEAFLKGVSKPDQAQLGDLGLQVLATQSGGLVLNSSDVVGNLQKCMNDAGASYDVSFPAASTERHDEYHELSVKIDKPGLTARTRKGYYSQP